MAANKLNQITQSKEVGWLRVRGELDEPATVTVAANGGAAYPASLTGANVFSAQVPVNRGTDEITISATDATPNHNNKTESYEVEVTTAGERNFSCDRAGNLVSVGTSSGREREYFWDAENRLVRIKIYNGGTIVESLIEYDGMGGRSRMIEKTNGVTMSTKRYVWDGLEICEERDNSSNVLRRFYPLGMQVVGAVAPSDKIFYSKDHLGSIRELVDDDEVVRAHYDYDVFGKPSKLTGNLDSPVLFTAHFYNISSGLLMSPYRFYDSDLGRWLSRDPIAESGGINLYGYVQNNPVNVTDPLGLWTVGVGVQASGGMSWGGSLSVGVNVGHASDAGWFSGWSGGLLATVGTGFYGGVGGSAGVFGSATNADCVDQLKGLGTAVGGSIGTPVSLGIESTQGINTNFSPDGALKDAGWGPSGYDVNLGVGGGPLPAEGHAFGTYTFGPTISQ